ncbi:MAG TPA: hypothetical protein VHL78_10815 [Actinomycetota bacterium]|nr:hypothetical protein [Actinomycetota bacterium]
MGLRPLARLAAGPVPTFVVPGRGGRRAADDLRLDGRLRLVDSPRAAAVLLVAGTLTDRLLPAAMLAHDQIPGPRATVQWVPEGRRDRLAGTFSAPVLLRGDVDVGAAVAATYRELLAGDRPSDPPVYPDVPPAPWRGAGPYGQGGKGMSGGVPYGRPLAGRAPDRDGLELDRLPLEIGPLFPPFPPGLILRIDLQGDVVQQVAGWENALAFGRPPRDIFRRALREPVALAELEVARARHHLRWLSGTLRLHGLPALGLRVLVLARRVGPGDVDAVASLKRKLERSRSLAWATRGIATLQPEDVRDGPGGPVARSAGIRDDLRTEDPAYRGLGFEPLTRGEGDARARWRHRLAEAVQALELAGRAGDRLVEAAGGVESPRGALRIGGSPSADLLSRLPALLPGREWGEAVALVHDLDLDMEEAVRAAREEAA